MVQVNRVCLKILFINRPQFLVDSNVSGFSIIWMKHLVTNGVVLNGSKSSRLSRALIIGVHK